MTATLPPKPIPEPSPRWHAMQPQQVGCSLNVDAATGSSATEARQGHAQFGANQLAEQCGAPAH
jgi:hypothetical protein